MEEEEKISDLKNPDFILRNKSGEIYLNAKRKEDFILFQIKDEYIEEGITQELLMEKLKALANKFDYSLLDYEEICIATDKILRDEEKTAYGSRDVEVSIFDHAKGGMRQMVLGITSFKTKDK